MAGEFMVHASYRIAAGTQTEFAMEYSAFSWLPRYISAMRVRIHLLAVCILGLVASQNAQTGAASESICDRVVTQIRGSHELNDANSQEDPFSVLTSGEHPYIRLAQNLDFDVETPQLLKSFSLRFNPSEKLTIALREFGDISRNGKIYALEDYGVHLIETVDGTANCESYLFFQTIRDGQSQLLPVLPSKGDRDGDNLICSGFHDSGYIARIGGSDVFLESRSSETGFEYGLRIVPLRAGQWAPACSVQAKFQTNFTVEQVFVPKDGPLSSKSLQDVAADIVEKHESSSASGSTSFSFGPTIPDREVNDAQQMIVLAEALKDSSTPAFGAEGQLGLGEESLYYADSYPVVLGGRTYLLRIGHAAIGWRIFQNSVVALYTLGNGKLVPTGTAIVAEKRGKMLSLESAPSR
jgi:hypothetical protein